MKPEEYRKYCSYVGNDAQFGGTRHYRLVGGVSDGCYCIDVRTGSGFEYTIVCDRGMDLSLASYKGINLTYLTEDLEKQPSFYDHDGLEWLRTFSGGLLTTCGPNYIGAPCTDDGEELGLHGRYSTIPAGRVVDLSDPLQGTILIKGEIREAHLFGSKLKIERTIRSEYGGSSVIVEDQVTNIGGAPAPLTMLYHMNFGYPFIDEDTEIHVMSSTCKGYNPYTEERMDQRFHMLAPDEAQQERNYLHMFDSGDDEVKTWLFNRKVLGGLAVYQKFSREQLPYMTQWMLENARDYTVALEPSNAPCVSRRELRETGLLPYILPGETKTFRVEFGVVEHADRICEVFGPDL